MQNENASTFAVLRRGIEAAMIASVPQVIIPKIGEKLFLPHHEDADLGPRLIEALAQKAQKPLPEDVKWLAAASFHFGYAAFWGAAYALVQQRVKANPVAGGLTMATIIYLMTFPPWGGAVLTGSEDHPRRRTWRKEIVLASAPLIFGLGTALLYGRGPKEGDGEW